MGMPEKATQKWLAAAGYSGGNAMTILPVLRFVGIIGKDGSPTEVWQALRRGDQQGRAEFAAAVRRAYADLFSIHPDAHRKDAEALRNFFRAHTTGGEQVQMRMVQTFKALTEFGDFDAEGPPTAVSTSSADEAPVMRSRNDVSPVTSRIAPAGAELTLTVNLQLQLPATTDADVYEKLFGAMRKHLMGLSDGT
jgi:Family of unknown function (DUF5343)